MMHPKITIAAGVYQVHHRHAVMIAKEQGFFKEEGILEFDIIVTNHDDDNLGRQLMAGRVQFGLDAKPQDVLRWVTKEGADICIIGSDISQFPMVVIGAKGIKSVAGLKGKRIGVTTGKSGTRVSLDATQSRTMLRAAGLDPDKDVTWVSGTQMHPELGDPVGALRRGEVDCVFVREVVGPKAEEEGFPVLLRFNEFYSDGYPVRVIIAAGAVIRQHPETVTAFLKALIRGYRFLRDMPKNYEYVVDLDKRIRAVDSDPKERVTDLKLTVEKLGSLPHPPDGRLPIKGFEVILAQEKEAGNIPGSLTMDKVTRLEFVEQANRELDSREDLREELKRVKQWVGKYGH